MGYDFQPGADFSLSQNIYRAVFPTLRFAPANARTPDAQIRSGTFALAALPILANRPVSLGHGGNKTFMHLAKRSLATGSD
jgi:hypothetical protein